MNYSKYYLMYRFIDRLFCFAIQFDFEHHFGMASNKLVDQCIVGE